MFLGPCGNRPRQCGKPAPPYLPEIVRGGERGERAADSHDHVERVPIRRCADEASGEVDECDDEDEEVYRSHDVGMQVHI